MSTNAVVARTWRGAVRTERLPAYLDYLRETGLREYRETPGCRGVLALSRDVDGRSELLLITLWESMDSIHAFAGEDIAKAVFYPADDDFLVDRDLHANHYDVVFEDLDETAVTASRGENAER